MAWTGDDRYLELRLLHVKGGMGNMTEWQLLSETIEHIHEKRLAGKKQTRPRRATTLTSCVLITEDEPISPITTRRGTKRDSKIKIDYKQYHQEGIVANKLPKKDKVLPHTTGPSQTRIAAQELIRGRKGRKSNTTVEVSTSSTNKKPINKPLTHEKGYPLPQNKQLPPVNSINVSTVLKLTATKRPVSATLSRTLGSPTSDDNYLPDLVTPSPSLGMSSHGIAIPVQTSNDMETTPHTPIISLISPPAINRTLDPPLRPYAEHVKTTTNLNDLQSTLEFSTDPVLGSEASDQITGELSTLDSMVPFQRDREVVTSDDLETDTERANAFAQSSPKECSTPKGHTERNNDRKVVTNNDSMDYIPATDSTNAKTPGREEHSENSQAFSSPRSVVTEPDQQEIDTANILVEMSNAVGTDDPPNYVIDKDHELPVNSDKLDDVVEQMNKTQSKASGSEDSDATVEYPDTHNDANKTKTDNELSPKGHIQYKHYGIKRQSPDQSKSRNYNCYLCEAICHSKHQLNKHHKSEHAKVKCPTCMKQFPTPDALQ